MKETDIHEKAMVQSPSFEMTRRLNAVVTKDREYKEISERYKTKKINIDEHFDKRIKDAIERLNKEREESHESLEKEYNGTDGTNGKIANAKDWLENCKVRLQQEKDKKPKQLLSLEFDYKKVLQDYYNEFKERPPYYFNFLENNDLPKDELEEQKPEVILIDPKIAAIQKMLEQNEIQRQIELEKERDRARKEQEEQCLNARTVYGDISTLERKTKPLMTPPPSVYEEEQEEQVEDSEQEKADLEDYKRRMASMKAPPPPAAPPLTQKIKKASIAARVKEKVKEGVNVYEL